jgi:hypothetical protein
VVASMQNELVQTLYSDCRELIKVFLCRGCSRGGSPAWSWGLPHAGDCSGKPERSEVSLCSTAPSPHAIQHAIPPTRSPLPPSLPPPIPSSLLSPLTLALAPFRSLPPSLPPPRSPSARLLPPIALAYPPSHSLSPPFLPRSPLPRSLPRWRGGGTASKTLARVANAWIHHVLH